MTIDDLIAELSRRRDLHGGETVVAVAHDNGVCEIEADHLFLDRALMLIIDPDGDPLAEFARAEFLRLDALIARFLRGRG